MKLRSPLALSFAILLALSACNLPVAPTGTVFPTPANFATSVVRTVQAMQTRDSGTRIALTNQPFVQTETPVPGVPTNTKVPGVTLAATQTQGGPTATQTPRPCDLASFVSDVTIPDGTKMLPGQTFSKTWRLRNTGTCAWNSSYSLAFISGEAMGAQPSVPLPGDVPAGKTVDLTINFTAPSKPGKVNSYWKLRNPAGVVFGVESDQPFYVLIEVVAPTVSPTNTSLASATQLIPTATTTLTPTITISPTATVTPAAEGVIYDFTAAACQAEWRSQAGVLTCPGNAGDLKGSVLKLTNPVLETGDVETHPVLETMPQIVDTGGAITGSYPVMMIQSGYHFRATLGCLNAAPNCKVKYQLNYLEGNSQPVNLGEWSQTEDGAIQGINIDLSALAGKNVQIILVVLADGAGSIQDQAVWVYPRISKG